MDFRPDIGKRFRAFATLFDIFHIRNERFCIRIPADFSQGKPGEFNHTDSSWKGFCGAFHQFKRLRTGQQELSFFFGLIAFKFYIAKKIRCPLHLIINDRRWIQHHKHIRIFVCLLLDKRVVDGNVFGLREKMLQQGGFTALPCPGDQHCFECFFWLLYMLLNRTFNVHVTPPK